MSALGRLPVPAAHRICSNMVAALASNTLSCPLRSHSGMRHAARHSNTPRTGIGWHCGPPHARCSSLIVLCESAASSAVRSARPSGASWRCAGVVALALPPSMASTSDTVITRALHSATAQSAATKHAAEAASPLQRGFRMAPDLVACLRRFNGLHAASLHDFTDVQTQLHMGKNKALMDLHHGNHFARDFLADDGMAEVLKLLHHHDEYVSREAFLLADALIQQGWVARQLVRRQLATRLAPLIGCQPGQRSLEAAGLSVQLLHAGTHGGYARDVAAQLLDAGGLENMALALWASVGQPQPRISGLAGQMVRGIVGCGPAFRRRLAAGGLLPALCSIASADLATVARSQRRPSNEADLSQLYYVAAGVTSLADAAVDEGRAATAMLLDTGVPELLIQLQTPWLANVRSVWRWQGRTALRGLAQHHPAALQRALDAVDVPFPPDTSPVAWQAWWADLRTDLQRAVAKPVANRKYVL